MDLTPFLASTGHGTPEEGLESIEIPGRVAVVKLVKNIVN